MLRLSSSEKRQGLLSGSARGLLSDEARASGKKGSIETGKVMELKRTEIREKLWRCPDSAIEVRKGSSPQAQVIREDVGLAGVLLTSKTSPVTVPTNPPPNWAYKHPMKTVTIDTLPAHGAVVIHPGEQRLYVRHSMKNRNDFKLYLDITNSRLRDRLTLYSDMEITFLDTISNKKRSFVIKSPIASTCAEVTLNPGDFWKITTSDVGSRLSSESQNPISDVEGVTWGSDTESSSFAASSTTSPSKESTKKSISWGTRTDVIDGTVSVIKTPDDSDNDSLSGSNTNELNGNENCVIELDQTTKYELPFEGKSDILIGGGSKDTLSDENTLGFIHLPFLPGDEIAAAISIEYGCCQFIRPRSHAVNNYRILLTLPPSLAVPLIADDVLVVRNSLNQDLVQLRVDIPMLPRGVPGGLETRLNRGHYMNDIGFETTYQVRKSRWNGSVETKTNSHPRSLLFPRKFFSPGEVKIGRGACEISIPDPHLSRHHCTIKRAPGGDFFVLSPADEKKYIYMLCGKTDSHSRPPIALRFGDYISIGRSEFKVVYQQRGDRELPSRGRRTAGEEMRTRLDGQRTQFDLDVRADVHDAGKRRPSVNLSDIVEPSETMDKSVLESKSQDESSVDGDSMPTFKDVPSLLEHYKSTDFGDGPILILMSIRGPHARCHFICCPLETTIGSSPYADISIPKDKRMSPYHCRIYFDTTMQRWMMEDLQSKHGTFIRVTEPALVCSGDVFAMGLTLLRVFGQSPLITPMTSSGKCKNS